MRAVAFSGANEGDHIQNRSKQNNNQKEFCLQDTFVPLVFHQAPQAHRIFSPRLPNYSDGENSIRCFGTVTATACRKIEESKLESFNRKIASWRLPRLSS